MSAKTKKTINPADLPPLVDEILEQRGYKTADKKRSFLNPDYDATNYDPYLLPDMSKAVERLKQARERGEQVTVYCDYDVDGTTACAVLLDALPKFGIKVNYYVPDRFKEGYGLNKEAIKKLKDDGTDLILTVDNGIVSFDEVNYANGLGLDVIITDHHVPRDDLPAAVAVVDPKISSSYPFCDLCGCGVAFKLVQALQKAYPDDLPKGQEKWLLDLVAMATVSDVVSLVDENRAIVYWGLEVIKRTKRPGIRALVAMAGLELKDVDSRAIGYVLGPRINAAGRLADAHLAVDLLSATDGQKALDLATELNELNNQRKSLQNEIYNQAVVQVKATEPVAIAIGDDWHEGVIGVVASKIEEKVEKPTFVFSRSRDGDSVKASGRSFGDFSIAAAINATSTLLERGGGHAAAGGITVARDNFDAWCRAVNDYYRSLNLTDQTSYLYPDPDVVIDCSKSLLFGDEDSGEWATKIDKSLPLDGEGGRAPARPDEVKNGLALLTPELVESLNLLEPFGEANPVPTFLLKNVIIDERRLMGSELNHVRYSFIDDNGNKLQAVAFNAADRFTLEPGEFGQIVRANALVELSLNEWRGVVSVQGRLLKLDNTSLR